VGDVVVEMTMSLDGFVAAPNPTFEEPLGQGGMRLHDWVFGLSSWRERHGLEGGTADSDSALIEESFASTGAVVMGRKMFSGGEGPWEDDPNANGWWGDEPPFHVPVFVLTHHTREPVTMQGGTIFAFVTGGIEAALAQARAAAGERNVSVAGGASVVQQLLTAGLVDELKVHVAPLLLGGGLRLFGDLDGGPVELEPTRVLGSPKATHLAFRLSRS
jgi:dihydrofolate reductase